jgi:hypothetical protein
MRKIMILASLSLAPLMATAAIADPEKPTAAQAAPEATKPVANNSAAVGKKIAEEWAKYDTAKKGHLTQEEFAKWMADLRASAGQPAPDANWLGSAFKQTDADSNKQISEEELKRFLLTGS